MEQTESTIVQIAPNFENEKIKEMEAFGWSLQGRQEIHEEGETTGGPNLSGDTYVIKTKVSHYVKLHFVRSFSLPNLTGIRKLESEYSNLPFPAPLRLRWPIILTIFPIIGIIMQLSDSKHFELGQVVVGIIWACLCGFWTYSRLQKNGVVAETRAVSMGKAVKIIGEARSLATAQPQLQPTS